MDNRFIIIGRSNCPFCTMAQDLLEASGVENVFLDYIDHPEILDDYKSFHQHETVPIVLSNNLVTGLVKKVGGYTDLLEYISE
tara:strand:- start:1487 stop:1735 length:249 start_codon:yes stop_codon:yes gene_type:complete